MTGTVIVGGGQAGFTVIDSLRRLGYCEPITLVEAGEDLPYQRPPLSKAYLTGELSAESLRFRPESYYRDADVNLVLGEAMTGVDHQRQRVLLASGTAIPYDHLVVAAGSRLRDWSATGSGLRGVHRLHVRADADELRSGLRESERAVVIGGGFIGFEFASQARKVGLQTTVVEAAPRPMARALSPLASQALTRIHREHDVVVRCATSVRRLLGTDRVTGVELADGECLPADLVVVGIGSVPALTGDAIGVVGTGDGAISVDDCMRTADPRVLACGDGVGFQYGDRWVRLESVQNATDQARCAAATIVGGGTAYDTVPWFWTEQYGQKLQIAGLLDQADEWAVRGDLASGHWTVFGFRADVVVGSESLASVGDHMATRTLLRSRAPLTPAQAADPDFDLRAYASGAQSVGRRPAPTITDSKE
ncbi:NAD(P)/FAD-dependent oxidoreductase [Streptomyces sp. NPDC002758]